MKSILSYCNLSIIWCWREDNFGKHSVWERMTTGYELTEWRHLSHPSCSSWPRFVWQAWPYLGGHWGRQSHSFLTSEGSPTGPISPSFELGGSFDVLVKETRKTAVSGTGVFCKVDDTIKALKMLNISITRKRNILYLQISFCYIKGRCNIYHSTEWVPTILFIGPSINVQKGIPHSVIGPSITVQNWSLLPCFILDNLSLYRIPITLLMDHLSLCRMGPHYPVIGPSITIQKL